MIKFIIFSGIFMWLIAFLLFNNIDVWQIIYGYSTGIINSIIINRISKNE